MVSTVRTIVANWLREHEYEGLCHYECGCGIAELMPCGDNGPCDISNCRPAYRYVDEDGEYYIGTKADVSEVERLKQEIELQRQINRAIAYDVAAASRGIYKARIERLESEIRQLRNDFLEADAE